MSTARADRQVEFTQGVFADVNILAQPRGTLPRASNVWLIERAALKTIFGSRLLASLDGNGATSSRSPFKALQRFVTAGGVNKILAAQVKAAKTDYYDVSGTSYADASPQFSIPATYDQPQMVPFGDKLAIASGTGQMIELWDGTTLSAVNNNAWSGITNLPFWAASQPMVVGQTVIPNPDNGHVYIVRQLSGDGKTGTNQPAFTTTVGGFTLDNNVLWQEAGPSSPPPPPGAAFLFAHEGFLFAWGTSATYPTTGLDGPDCLRQSDLNNPNSWNPINQTFIAKGDSQTPQGGAVMTLGETGIPATNQLLLFKDKSTYVLLGAFPAAQLVKVASGMGCVAPGTIQFVQDLGVMRLCHLGVALFDGQNDNVVEYTAPIRGYLFGGLPGITPVDWPNIALARSTQTADPPGYIMFVPIQGNVTRGFHYDIASKAWSVIDLPWAIGAAAYLKQDVPSMIALVGGAADGTVRRIFYRDDLDWDGTPINWSLRTPRIGLGTTPSFIRRANLRAESALAGGTVPTTPPQVTKAVLNYLDRQGSAGSRTLTGTGAQALTNSFDIGDTLLDADLDISGQGPAILYALEVQDTPKPPSALLTAPPLAPTAWGMVLTFTQVGQGTVGAGLSTVHVTFAQAAANASYFITATANWNTTVDWANKTVNGFDLVFGTAAPTGGGLCDWHAFE